MNYLLILTVALAVGLQGMCQKGYNLKFEGRGVFTFASLSALFSALFFLAVNRGLHVVPALIPYSFLFALGYFFGITFVVLACGHGSLALTSLMVSFSPIIPTVYGLVFLDEPARVWPLFGVVLLIASLVVVNYPGKSGRVTLKWLFFALLTFLGNGLCGIVLKVQALEFSGAYGRDFMILSLLMVAVVTFFLTVKTEKRNLGKQLKAGFLLYTVCGLLNGLHNTLNVTLASRMPASLMFPLQSAGGILVTLFISSVFYREKLTARQLVGFFLGLGAIILLSI